MMIIISICICTRKRPEGLKKLLNSIENLETPRETDIRIVIVENDSKNLSENIVKDFSDKSKLRISYFLEPSQGIVFARNRSVAEAFLKAISTDIITNLPQIEVSEIENIFYKKSFDNLRCDSVCNEHFIYSGKVLNYYLRIASLKKTLIVRN